MAGVASGDLRHRVRIEAPTGGQVQDPNTGEMTSEWETVADVWADVVPMSAREFVAAGAEQSEVRGRMVIRYREDVDATMRVFYRGRYYAIFGVMPDDVSGREHLTLMTGEGVRLNR